MNIVNTSIPGVLIIEPRVLEDERGFFFESFNENRFKSLTGADYQFVQDNHSRSKKNVLRGLHYQISKPQGKLVRVVYGEVFDVVVDLRKSSAHFGKWVGVTLSAENRKQLWIPPGFAHGFLTVSDHAEFLYKTTDYWAPEYERTIRWDDPGIGIEWPNLMPILSKKDLAGSSLSEAEVFS